MLTIRRARRHMSTIPPEQDVVEILEDGYVIEVMGRWSTLCLPGGSVNALDATDEQILAAYTHDESVFYR